MGYPALSSERACVWPWGIWWAEFAVTCFLPALAPAALWPASLIPCSAASHCRYSELQVCMGLGLCSVSVVSRKAATLYSRQSAPPHKPTLACPLSDYDGRPRQPRRAWPAASAARRAPCPGARAHPPASPPPLWLALAGRQDKQQWLRQLAVQVTNPGKSGPVLLSLKSSNLACKRAPAPAPAPTPPRCTSPTPTCCGPTSSACRGLARGRSLPAWRRCTRRCGGGACAPGRCTFLIQPLSLRSTRVSSKLHPVCRASLSFIKHSLNSFH